MPVNLDHSHLQEKKFLDSVQQFSAESLEANRDGCHYLEISSFQRYTAQFCSQYDVVEKCVIESAMHTTRSRQSLGMVEQ